MPVFKKDVGWIPWALRLPSLLVFVFFDLALVCCLIALSVRSSQHDGFATIGGQDVTSLGINWNLGLLWTTLPVLVFRMLGLYWEWITSPIFQRQPYVDLLKDGGAPAAKSVLLDYLAVPLLWRWWTASKNKHFLVGACSFLTLVMSIVVSALSARLFAVKTVVTGADIPVLFNTTFDAAALNASINWVPVLDTVSAINVYHGNALPWTDEQYAFQPYLVQGSVVTGSNVTASTNAYSAYLNCSVLSDFRLEFNDPKLKMTASDRGCDIAQDFDVSESQQVYFKTSSEIGCSAAAWYSRLVFTAATYSSDSPTRVNATTVLSCITSYRVTTGDLVTTAPRNSMTTSPTVTSFQPWTLDNARPTLWRVFEQNIISPATLNAQQTIWSTSAFGTLVLYLAQQLGGNQYLSPDVLQRAVPEVFSSVYLTAVAKHAFVPLRVPTEITGEMSQLTQRLFTVYWVAYVIIVILLLSMCVVLVAIAHVYTNATVLEEEPAGLLAYAALLSKSPLMDFAAGLRAQGNKQVVKTAAKSAWKDSRWGEIGKTGGGGWVIGRLE
ncbi:hypothetical protein K458DRAFT_313934 [Lentithecium fluviatile CBS 122367]|uniref:Uncharacterized protein n=1 Tax=Lentithecium fluviatile CBS 122367 TaxID=1168545 RepID=A0A6G1IMS1_9PLEO|nr:hypothetical protein K458DRAFT_313934 [Lentithecium fluviatile CBS 122367]